MKSEAWSFGISPLGGVRMRLRKTPGEPRMTCESVTVTVACAGPVSAESAATAALAVVDATIENVEAQP